VANTITVTYKVNEDGSLQKIAQGAEKAAQATDKVTKASANHNKVQKGVAQTGLSSAKSFSKMSSGIQGGLVPAYATLAAHVFAVTAAFGVLSRSQAVQQLTEGLLFTGRAAGDNLTIVTANLREITENAVSSAEAMRALAVGVSAGFSESQMEGLTKVAKGASLALGRDMTDALDRLVRGAAKLEPEILDELGIMVRLDDATENYAATLGVAADDLTQFERRMAFTNAIIEQGEAKFGALSASVASNPFNQLAATFDDLVKGGMNFINLVVGPIAGFLAGNMAALIATMGVLGTGVINMMVPALTQAGAASADLAKQMADSAKQTIAATKATAGSPKVFTKLSKQIADGTASAEDYTKAQDSLRKSVDLHKKQLPGMLETHKADSDTIKKKVLTIKENEFALYQLTNAQQLETLSTKQSAQADILANASAGNFRVTIQLLRAELLRESIQLKVSTLEKGFLASAYARVTAWAGFAALSVKAFGLALLQSIPVIGQVIMAAMLLWEGIKWMFGDDAKKTANPLLDVLKEGKERFEEYPNIINQMATSYDAATTALDKYLISLKTQNGLLKQTVAQMSNLRIAEEVKAKYDKVTATSNLLKAQKKEKDARAILAQAGVEVAEGEKASWLQWTKEFVLGTLYRNGIDSKTRTAALDALNEAVDAQKEAQTIIDEASSRIAAGPSEERMRGAIENLEKYRESQIRMQESVAKGSEEYKSHGRHVSLVTDMLNRLSAETLPVIEQELSALSATTNKTTESFQALIDIGKEVDAMFAKRAANSGTFAEELTLLGKGKDAIKRTDSTEKQNAVLTKTFSNFKDQDGNALVTNEESLDKLIGRYKEVADFRKAEAKNDQILQNSNDVLNKAGLQTVALLATQTDLNNKLTNIVKEKALAKAAGLDGEKEEVERLKILNSLEKTRIDLINDRQKTSARLGGDAIGSVTAVTAYAETNADAFDGASNADKIKMLSEAVQPMMKDLEKLGPQGELIASAIQGTLQLGEAFERLTEKLQTFGFTSNMTFDDMKAKFMSLDFKQKLQVIGAGLQVAGAAVAALGNAIAAAAANNIAGVDNQIAAEKKRDGQSAASLEKIKALEARKEQMKRKEFETNKKFQIANAIIATAVGVTQALAIPGIGMFLAPIIAAMGMAQVAIISGMTYQGGASGVASASPSKISVGNRQNSVDLANSKSASGELAYMRGESGIGSSASNFKPAFTGAKYRAAGGMAGYMVGEQGPELFMPDRPGRVVPAGEVGNAVSAPVNVSFSIQTIDSQDMEQALIRQRGNIIGMIREAANNHGEFFLESVNTQSYETGGGGRQYDGTSGLKSK